MRGKEQTAVQMGVRLGITPAYAGKRPTAKGCSSGSRDYPSVCGEKTPDASSTTKSIGSPPRMRGKDFFGFYCLFPDGITPAYAGKSLRYAIVKPPSEDHPRVCGEKKAELTPDELSRGSPPRMRGKDFLLFHRLFSQGITPAYAGKSRSRRTTVRPLRDHPRVCGEKHLCSQLERPPPGSPPRVRGKAGL